MAFGIDFPNLSNTNPFLAIDTYVAAGGTLSGIAGQNGNLVAPGSVWTMPVELYNQYSGFNSLYNPVTTFVGTTNSTTAVTAVNNTKELFVGMAVSGSGIPAGTTIAAIPSTTTLTLSAAATSSVTLNQFTGSLGTKIFNGAAPVLKYVRYLSQNNPALNAYPSAVYYTDSTFTTVTGYAGEAFGNTTNQAAVNANAGAGILLYNTTSSGLTGAASATALNGNWCWIQVGGLCPTVACPASVVIGDSLSMSVSATAAFTMVRTALGTANPYQNYIGVAQSNLSANNTADILINSGLSLI